MKRTNETVTKDKCNLCGWEGPSDKVVEKEIGALGTTWHCPICDSQDLDDSEFNPYEDDDPGDDDGGVDKGDPNGNGFLFG